MERLGGVGSTVCALSILVMTVVLIIFRPFRISEGIAGLFGGFLMLASGIVKVTDIADVLSGTSNILIMFLGMMIISIVVDEAGFFEWAAIYAASMSKGKGMKLFLNTFLLGTAVTTVISNDATALIITPIVYAFVSALKLQPLPFLLACTFIADTASLSLPVSNLTNLLVYDQVGLGFGKYVLVMFAPSIVAIVINIVLFVLLFRKDIPESFDISEIPAPSSAIRNRFFFTFATVMLFATIIGYVVGAFLGIPLSWVSTPSALILLLVGCVSRNIRLPEVLKQVSWSVMAFVIGMFVIIRGVQNVGISSLLGERILHLSNGGLLGGVLLGAFGTAIGSNFVNNVPMDMMMISVINSLRQSGVISRVFEESLAYSTVLGAGLGPNITIVGSLATMLWLGTIRRKGVDITAVEYLRVGLITTPFMILASAIALWLSVLLIAA